MNNSESYAHPIIYSNTILSMIMFKQIFRHRDHLIFQFPAHDCYKVLSLFINCYVVSLFNIHDPEYSFGVLSLGILLLGVLSLGVLPLSVLPVYICMDIHL